MTQITPIELITKTLEQLSTDLHNKVESHLSQTSQAQQTQITEALAQLLPNLLEQLTPIIKAEVKKQVMAHNQLILKQVESCLSELENTNRQQLKMLKLGREEYQLLQQKMQSTLMALDNMALLDDDAVKDSLETLQESITSLQTQMQELITSQQAMMSEHTDLVKLIDELEGLKQDMTMTLSSLKQQQTTLVQSLAQFQPLLKR